VALRRAGAEADDVDAEVDARLGQAARGGAHVAAAFLAAVGHQQDAAWPAAEHRDRIEQRLRDRRLAARREGVDRLREACELRAVDRCRRTDILDVAAVARAAMAIGGEADRGAVGHLRQELGDDAARGDDARLAPCRPAHRARRVEDHKHRRRRRRLRRGDAGREREQQRGEQERRHRPAHGTAIACVSPAASVTL
jgi:hypothetical protein